MKVEHLTDTSKAIIITPEDKQEAGLLNMLWLFVTADDEQRAMLREITTIDNGMVLKVMYEEEGKDSDESGS